MMRRLGSPMPDTPCLIKVNEKCSKGEIGHHGGGSRAHQPALQIRRIGQQPLQIGLAASRAQLRRGLRELIDAFAGGWHIHGRSSPRWSCCCLRLRSQGRCYAPVEAPSMGSTRLPTVCPMRSVAPNEMIPCQHEQRDPSLRPYRPDRQIRHHRRHRHAAGNGRHRHRAHQWTRRILDWAGDLSPGACPAAGRAATIARADLRLRRSARLRRGGGRGAGGVHAPSAHVHCGGRRRDFRARWATGAAAHSRAGAGGRRAARTGRRDDATRLPARAHRSGAS